MKWRERFEKENPGMLGPGRYRDAYDVKEYNDGYAEYLEKNLSIAVEGFNDYGLHNPECAFCEYGEPCDCGFQDTAEKIKGDK